MVLLLPILGEISYRKRRRPVKLYFSTVDMAVSHTLQSLL